MEHWLSPSILSQHTTEDELQQALAATTGNIQSYSVDVGDGIENQDPNGVAHSSLQAAKAETCYPPPAATLCSNDERREALQRLHRRRQQRAGGHRRGADPKRPYLQNQKYLKYLSRQRQDTGADGKPVWDAIMEDSFQNALVHIEPMGRRKKSQHSKPYGRNELIAEWIYQETGRIRTRKQVSSHIQVLNALLKGIPEWDALITAIADKNMQSSRSDYYGNSIQQKVQGLKAAHNSQYKGHIHGVPGPASALDSKSEPASQHHISKLSFHMWVSLPNQMDFALHSYTRLQNIRASSADAPLESITNWRQDFPYLDSVLRQSNIDSFEVIHLGVSFQLMDDFPPRFSKLGISLELDFLHPRSDFRSLSELRDWSCTTHMYQRGQLIKVAQYDECHVASIGKVKPFFESKWWASTFTQLTENRKKAEDSKDTAAIRATNEAADRFFRGLTVVQEITASPAKEVVWNDEAPIKTRMAVLLWRFARAQHGYVGTTTWSKLILPPDRIRVNSPAPVQEMGLPPLTMDTVVGDHTELVSNSKGSFLAQHDITMSSLYDVETNDGLCPPGSMAFSEEDLASFAQPFDTSTGFADPQLENDDQYMSMDHYNQLMFDVSQELYSMQQNTQLGPLVNDRPPDLHRTLSQPAVPTTQTLDHQQQLELVTRRDSVDDLPRRPLTSFDVNTHKILQVQLDVGNDCLGPKTAPASFAFSDQARLDDTGASEVIQGSSMEGVHQLDTMCSLAYPVPQLPSQLDPQFHQDSRTITEEQQRNEEDQQHWQIQNCLVAPVPTRPQLRNHVSYLQCQEPPQLQSFPALKDVPAEDELCTDRRPIIDMDTFDADNFAAVLSAHNSQIDEQHCVPTEEDQQTGADQRIKIQPSQYSSQNHAVDTFHGLESTDHGVDPFL